MPTLNRFANIDIGNFTGAIDGVQVIPVTINGFRRVWSSSDGHSGNARLVLEPDAGSSVAATAFEASDPELLDALRYVEAFGGGVQRVIGPRQVTPWRETPLANAMKQVAAYRYWSPDKARPVTQNQPIHWAQAATVLIACHRAGGLNFVDDFIRSTGGWDSTWLDDRQVPVGPLDLSDATRLEILVAREKLLARLRPELRLTPDAGFHHCSSGG